MSKKVALTGIKPTGVPHIGNYFGAIKPALTLTEEFETRYFIADYHALNSIKDPKAMKQQTYEVAATWLACGLDPDKALIYKQSDVPQTFELSTILMAFTSKGLMNRAHAYKAMVQSNKEVERDIDDGVNIGLFTYPILMAADILLFDSDVVPVGKDQQQHLEMAADIAQSINHIYKDELLVVPEPLVRETGHLVIGMDGRKMSKSYNNTIPLFLPTKKLRKMVMKIVTNSQTVEEVKDPDTCNVFALYKLFATAEQQEKMRCTYLAGGMGWGFAKQSLFELMEEHFAPMREKYDELMSNKSIIDRILHIGSAKARKLAETKMEALRKAIGAR